MPLAAVSGLPGFTPYEYERISHLRSVSLTLGQVFTLGYVGIAHQSMFFPFLADQRAADLSVDPEDR